MKSILFSDKDFGGAEIYVRNLKKRFNVDFISIRNNNILSLLLNLYEYRIIFHDLRAALLKFLSAYPKIYSNSWSR